MTEKNKAIPVYICQRINNEITVDGKLTELDWDQAEIVTLVDRYGNNTSQKTTVQLLHNGEKLFIAFTVIDTEVIATYTERDSKVWLEEAVEFFITPASFYPDPYFEFQISPRNVYRDVLVKHQEYHGDWDCKNIKIAVFPDFAKLKNGQTNKWTVEIALPLQEINNQKTELENQWRVNFYRIDRKPCLEFSCWSPTYEQTFHVPERFGRLILK